MFVVVRTFASRRGRRVVHTQLDTRKMENSCAFPSPLFVCGRGGGEKNDKYVD